MGLLETEQTLADLWPSGSASNDDSDLYLDL